MTSPPPLPSRPGVLRVFAGIGILLVWIPAHVILFYLIFASSFLLEIFLGIARSILFPGDTRPIEISSDGTLWAALLTAGLWLGGAAGVPLGLRVFWHSQARRLARLFWFALLAGWLFDAGALVLLANSLLHQP